MEINQNQLRYPDDLEASLFWDEGNLHILLANNQEVILRNAYVSSLKYDFLDSNNEFNENITMIGNNKKWDK